MLKVICQNHQEMQNIGDVLRLYFTDFTEHDQMIEIMDQTELNRDLTIVSFLERPISIEEMRDQDEKTEVRVKTYLQSADLAIEKKVIPSAVRREIKRQMYYVLSELLQIKYPWGSLTGIRPTQIAYRSYLKHQEDVQEAERDLINNWFVKKDKAEICLETAIAEMKMIHQCSMDLPMLYIGIPFCRTRCAYCSFITCDATAKSANLDLYVSALIKEIQQLSAFLKMQGKAFQAIYVGGGTPTALPDQGFLKLIKSIRDDIPKTQNCELTIEAGRPDSITRTKLEMIQLLPDVRICINPQTMHDRTLQLIGRDHTVEQVYDSFTLARELGFDSINMDLILGLPQESPEDFLLSVEKILELSPESITLHTMALKKSAFLNLKYNEEYMSLRFPDENLAEAFRKAIAMLKSRDYEPYYMYRQKNVRAGLENIGFTKKNHACIYNVGMMSDLISVLGVGSGSSTKIVQGSRVERLHNPKDLNRYVERITEITKKKIEFFA